MPIMERKSRLPANKRIATLTTQVSKNALHWCAQHSLLMWVRQAFIAVLTPISRPKTTLGKSHSSLFLQLQHGGILLPGITMYGQET